MRKSVLVVPALALIVAGCGGGGVFNRGKPDEFAVGRAAPLVIPPDYSLTPPRPGAPRPQAVDTQGQALEALFPANRARAPSASEKNLLDESGATPDRTIGARSTVGDPETLVVDKGSFTRDIVAAPAMAGDDTATVSVGG
jgi:hypothetical protein